MITGYSFSLLDISLFPVTINLIATIIGDSLTSESGQLTGDKHIFLLY
jgi:hypothetical protein